MGITGDVKGVCDTPLREDLPGDVMRNAEELLSVVGYHFGNHFVEGYFRDPAQVGFGFRGVTKQGLYFCGTEVSRIDPNNTLPCAQRWVSMGRVDSGNSANFLQTHSFPTNGYADPDRDERITSATISEPDLVQQRQS
jgi:hypothetical protein